MIWIQSLRESRSKPERDERLLRDLRSARRALSYVDDYSDARVLERAFDDVEEQMLALADETDPIV